MTDYDTGLQWERKTFDDGVHRFDNLYRWSADNSADSGPKPPSGTAFTEFLATLNDGKQTGNLSVWNCFADHCDWRLPSFVELLTIVDMTEPVCGTVGGGCFDTVVFWPASISFGYWTATTDQFELSSAFPVNFRTGQLMPSYDKYYEGAVRAVRSAL